MKHNYKITAILIIMFFLAQLIGIFVSNAYLPIVDGEEVIYNLPYGFDPPEDLTPQTSVSSILLALMIAIMLMFVLMKLRAEIFLRIWFLVVVILGIALALNAFMIKLPYSSIIAIGIAIPLGLMKIFNRDIIMHNLTELLVYPGIAAVFIPLLNIKSVVILLIIISIYDMYAVWHSGFMQKMAKYQLEKIKVFSGFLIPYRGKKEKGIVKSTKESKRDPKKKIKVNVAILGGGDVVFPILLAGVVLAAWGILASLIIAIGSTISLALLLYNSEKGKFYPAMPFISTGCLIALFIASLV